MATQAADKHTCLCSCQKMHSAICTRMARWIWHIDFFQKYSQQHQRSTRSRRYYSCGKNYFPLVFGYVSNAQINGVVVDE